MQSIKKQLTPKKFKEADLNKSAGILDDFAIRKVISTREGTIEKVPVENNDIVNKAYCDSNAGVSATPGGNDTEIQFNDVGVFGGDTQLTWNKTNNYIGLNNFKFRYWNGSIYMGDGVKVNASDVGNTFLAIGSCASVNGATFNTNIGYRSGRVLANGDYNCVFGADAGYSLSSGLGNVLIGYEAGRAVSNTSNNVLIGRGAGRASNQTESVAIGYNAGYNLAGTGNVCIGSNAGYNETGSNKLYIENTNSATPLIYGDFSSDYVYINGDFKVTGNYKSSDGTDGASATTGGATFKNGLYTSGTISAASSIATLTDVDLTGLTNGMTLVYSSTSSKWEADYSVNFGVTDGNIPYSTTGLDNFNYDSDFKYNGTELSVPKIIATNARVEQTMFMGNAFNVTLPSSSSSVAVTFPFAYSNPSTPIVVTTPPYQTSFWITNLTYEGFTLNVGTQNGYDSIWGIVSFEENFA